MTADCCLTGEVDLSLSADAIEPTSTDFVSIFAEGQPKDETSVEVYMTTDVITAPAQDSIRDVFDAMTEHGFHHIPSQTKQKASSG